MSVPRFFIPSRGLVDLSLRNTEGIHYQSTVDELVKDSLGLGEGKLSDNGALVIQTGAFTGRAPKDRFIVQDDVTANIIDWNEFNNPIAPKYYHIIYNKIVQYLSQVPDVWIRDCYACADPQYRQNIRVVTEKPWISLFVHNMLLRPTEQELENFKAAWHLFSAPDLKLAPPECGVPHENAVIISLEHKTILIAGTGYTGETKKSIFSVLNYMLPQERNVLSMHCSANMGDDGDTALFFGLSGTGKTTLSTDANRKLIGDDEHGWSDTNVFNFEGGCYAKTINLSKEKEPQIFDAIRPGALVENVTFFEGTNRINFDDDSITENTRVSYPLLFIPNALVPAIGNPPKNIFFLTCDAFGVLPPISLLTPAQAMYQFISGYTAKIAGTESGITEPIPTFSACFGAPFLPLHPSRYAAMLGEKMQKYNVNVWLVNTGWTGGPYGESNRLPLSYTRAMITAALNNELTKVPTVIEPVFYFTIPTECSGVPKEILQPRNTWKNKDAFDEKVKFLAQLFIQNFEKFHTNTSEEIRKAAPKF